ncbi:MAG: exodeoxyribonuclease V subunit alpha [Gammaproteobacteria bacterium]|nr:exodeoxyribonuclease V subunit alpha [Gammaproteobacteria bacterium]
MIEAELESATALAEFLKVCAPMDREIARLACRRHTETTIYQAASFALLSQLLRSKNSRVSVNELFLKICQSAGYPQQNFDFDHYVKEITRHPFVGTENDSAPFILRGEYFYIRRYYDIERFVAGDLSERNKLLDISFNKKIVDAFRKQTENLHVNQKLAVGLALTRQLTIITGGPGTGKTATLAVIIDLLLRNGVAADKMCLAAPTGKAANRMQEAIKSVPGASGVYLSVSTLHRLLGASKDGRRFRYNAKNKLRLDLLVIDEASMLDVEMAGNLLSALEEHCRLILIGDPWQLPSVELGNFLSDVSFTPAYDQRTVHQLKQLMEIELKPDEKCGHLLFNSLCNFSENFRFKSDSGIDNFTRALRSGETEKLRDILEQDASGQVKLVEHSRDQNTIPEEISLLYKAYVELCANIVSPEKALLDFNRSAVMTLTKDGTFGVNAINSSIENFFSKMGLLRIHTRFYHGRPILITRNDYKLKLFNGDTGICFYDQDRKKIMAYFINEENGCSVFPPEILPPHETCFAITVHKSQGSEYDHVALVIPPGKNPGNIELFNKQTLYTAVSRGKEALTIYANLESLLEMSAQGHDRSGALKQFLSGPLQQELQSR